MCTHVCSAMSDSVVTPWIITCQAPVHGVFWVGILELVATSFSRGSSWPRDWTCISCVSCIGRWVLYQLSHPRSPLVCVYSVSSLSIHCWWMLRLLSYLGYFKYAVTNIGVHISFKISMFVVFGFLKVELLHCRVVLFLIFWGTSILFSIMAPPIYIPTSQS